MVELKILGIDAQEAERLREWKKEPVADRWVFEKVLGVLDKALGDLPRSISEQNFWQSVEGQFFAELLWDTCPPEDRLDTTGAITKAYGEPADYDAWWRLYMRLNRAVKSGRVHSHRQPERDLKRKKNSSKEQGRWYYALEIDKELGK
jgi:hypothetical protein